jgi:hypothetical protein
MKNIQTPIKRSIGNQLINICKNILCCSGGFASTDNPNLFIHSSTEYKSGLAGV